MERRLVLVLVLGARLGIASVAMTAARRLRPLQAHGIITKRYFNCISFVAVVECMAQTPSEFIVVAHNTHTQSRFDGEMCRAYKHHREEQKKSIDATIVQRSRTRVLTNSFRWKAVFHRTLTGAHTPSRIRPCR